LQNLLEFSTFQASFLLLLIVAAGRQQQQQQQPKVVVSDFWHIITCATTPVLWGQTSACQRLEDAT
jgi:hypothetical protein